ncbi:MAG: hypothetical protein FWG35_05365 [Spirochaetaceae bacterium]|nr:hypothetical protein [Spirochaetaceae bacterium]
MEEKTASPQLEETLARFQDHLNRDVLPKLKEDFRLIHSAYKTVHSILLKKGFIHDDPYKGDTRLSEIIIPSNTAFSDAEKIDQMSIRLSSFEVQLDFLLNYYQFSMEFLDISRIRLVTGLLRYIKWDQLGPTAQEPVTKALTDFVAKAKTGAEPLSVSLINDSIEQIRKTVPACIKPLKDITDFGREYYKMEMREKVFPAIKTSAQSGKDEILRQVKKVFPSAMQGKAFYPELVEEVFEEDFGQNGEKLKAAIIQRFTLKEAKPKVVQQKISFTGMLMDAIRILAAGAGPLEESAAKLVENNILMQNKKTGFMEKLKQWISQMSNKQDEGAIYEIDYFDNVSSTTKHERILFDVFIADVQKRARTFNGINVRGSAVTSRMEKSDEDTLYSFLEKQISDLAIIYRRLQGLDNFFKAEIPREQRGGLKGIKIELTGINNAMARATQKKHEYIARKDEHDQMRKLGIG